MANVFKVEAYYRFKRVYLLDYIELSKKANNEFDAGRINEARNLLNKGLAEAKRKGHKPYIEFFSCELDYINEDYESAINHNKKALELDPKNLFLFKNLGFIYNNLDKHEKAIELYDKVLEIKPDDWLTQIWKSRIAKRVE